jgi:hypothetical protein
VADLPKGRVSSLRQASQVLLGCVPDVAAEARPAVRFFDN